jgi:spore coat polysaccharide biosynthesis protein SpsF
MAVELYKDRVVAIIQARMASTRLPGKTMMKIDGKPMLQHMIERVAKSNEIDDIVIATTESSLEIANFCFEKNIKYYSGDENNVIWRVLKAAAHFSANIIVDLTSDCPLVDPKQIDYLVKTYKTLDPIFYASNVYPRCWPDGFDIQIYDRESLEGIYFEGVEKKYEQHTGWNITNSGILKPQNIFNLEPPPKYNLPDLRLTVDYKEDFDTISDIIKHFNGTVPTAQEIIDYVLGNPYVLKNNDLVSKQPGE